LNLSEVNGDSAEEEAADGHARLHVLLLLSVAVQIDR
jgi:hypothetical protein